MNTLPLLSIRTDGGTQPRAQIDMFTVDDYADAMKAGVAFPPVDVFFDGSEYWLADGFHRYRAAVQACLTEIAATVHQGTRRDAILFSVGANAAHGLRRTNADKRRAVETLLRDEEWGQWGDREIGRRCAVTHPFVGSVRVSLVIVTSEGRTYTTKHGTPATMNTARIGRKSETEKIPEDVRAAVRELPLADNPVEVRRLGTLPEEEQREVVQVLAAKPEKATVRGVVKEIAGTKRRQEREAQAQAEPVKPEMALAPWQDWLPVQPTCDLLLTDPIYKTDVPDINAFADGWLPQALAKVKPAGRAYVFIGAYPEELAAYLRVGFSAAAQLGFTLANVLVWEYRNTIGPAPKMDYKLNWQAVLYFRGPQAPPLDCPELTEQFSVHPVNAPDGRLGERYHAWQKPDELAERLVRHSTKPGDLVLDPFAGTGTFILAANRLGRVGKGCDNSEERHGIALQRGCAAAGLRDDKN